MATMIGSEGPQKCNLCLRTFGELLERHSCKRCKQLVCETCAKKKRIIPGHDDARPHRVCNICEEDVRFQLKLKAYSKIMWNTNSEVGIGWVTQLKELDDMKKAASYQDYLKSALSIDDKDYNFVVIDKDVADGRTDKRVFNYSMREFLFYVQEELSTEGCRENIINVCKAFCMRNPDIGYVQGMNQIACFLLMFLQEENAFWAFCYLIEKILPPYFFSKIERGMNLFGFHAEYHVLFKVFPKMFRIQDEKTIATISNFIELVLPSLLIPLYVDILNLESVYYIFGQLFETQNWLIIEKFTLAILESIKDTVLEGEFAAMKEYRLLFSRRVSSKYLIEKIKDYNLTAEEVSALKAEFEQDVTLKWDQKSEGTYNLLSKITKFTSDEIQSIQEKYVELKKTLPDSEGISRSVFLDLMHNIAITRGISLSTDSYEKIFEYFDMNRDSFMDFKEFLSCASLLLRGDMQEKLEFAFKINDMKSKGYLIGIEFKSFLDLVSRMASIFKGDTEQEKFEVELEKFREEAYDIYKSSRNFRLIHLQEISKSPFIQKLQIDSTKRHRKGTVLLIRDNIMKNTSEIQKITKTKSQSQLPLQNSDLADWHSTTSVENQNIKEERKEFDLYPDELFPKWNTVSDSTSDSSNENPEKKELIKEYMASQNEGLPYKLLPNYLPPDPEILAKNEHHRSHRSLSMQMKAEDSQKFMDYTPREKSLARSSIKSNMGLQADDLGENEEEFNELARQSFIRTQSSIFREINPEQQQYLAYQKNVQMKRSATSDSCNLCKIF